MQGLTVWVQVQYILESVVRELARQPARRFTQVETAFLHQWWEDKAEDRLGLRNLTMQLVQAGQC